MGYRVCCVLLATALLAVGSCSDDETVSLGINVQTDIVPRVEFLSAEVHILNEKISPEEHVASRDNDYARNGGFRIASFSGLNTSSARIVEARLVNREGTVVGKRTMRLVHQRDAIRSLPIPRSCFGVECPDGQTCIGGKDGGRCVSIDCQTGQEEACNPQLAECQNSTDCDPQAECTDVLCEGTACLYIPSATNACSIGEYCSPENGCITDPTTALPHKPMIGDRSGRPTVAANLTPTFSWRGVGNRSRYEIQVSTECVDGMIQECAFSAPVLSEQVEGTSFTPSEALMASTSAPVGMRYYWRVRDCDQNECNEKWSTVRYVDIGRVKNDFNGDGLSDLVVGAPFLSTSKHHEGGFHVYYGAEGGLPTTPDLTISNVESEADSLFAFALTDAGDINGDGYSDLAVGAYSKSETNADEGAIYIFFGSATGLQADQMHKVSHPNPERDARFGWSINGVGDIDGDGFADLAVGAPFQDGSMMQDDKLVTIREEGRVYIIPGAASETGTAHEILSPSQRVETRFGNSLDGGSDINGDGFPDLVIAATGALNGAGIVYVYFGRVGNVQDQPSMILTAPANALEFGHALESCGDLNGDGVDDLAIGAHRYDDEAARGGSVSVYFGARGNVSLDPGVVINDPLDQAGGAFGFALGSGDINGDGLFDLVIGAKQQANPEVLEGNAYLVLGTSTDFGTMPAAIDHPQDRASERFGHAVSLFGDADGDGFDELAVSALQASNPEPSEGVVYLFSGSGTPDLETSTTLDNPASPASAAGRYGASMN